VSDAVEPFRIAVPDEVLNDLRARLRQTRWPEQETVADWSQGAPLSYVQEVCRYWADGYDWRSREQALNRFSQFKTTIDGVGIHFIHVRSPQENAFPLVITHGWPGSVVEFHKVIEPLTNPPAHGGDPADAFHVVCPSLPGYGFSDKPTGSGWNVPRIATAWDELMGRIGYDRYGAQGGDWGAAVTTAIGEQNLGHCVGIHLNMPVAGPGSASRENPSPEDEAAFRARKYYDQWDSGYSKQQSTRPQTLGYGLTDSPAGQAAWILEKFWAWTDCDGHPENVLSRDEMLDNIMLYWATGSATSSARLYWESFARMAGGQVAVPSGVASFPKEIIKVPRKWAERRYTDLRHWTDMPKGGHFAAFEQPELFVQDLRAFFRLVR
jgi:pimeloyl-ACP methyl ester carboxylesterase